VAEDLNKTGKVHFEVCRNTLTERGWKPADVFPFAKIVPSGAQEVMLRQQQGYVYFKP
jgi:intracellular sulfur oxidation DsrE/DsrF family protein